MLQQARIALEDLREYMFSKASRGSLAQGDSRPREVFSSLMNSAITDGCFGIVQNGEETVLGNRRFSPVAVMRILSPEFFGRVLRDGSLGMGESYMEGLFAMEKGTLEDLLSLLLRNRVERHVQDNKLLVLKILSMRVEQFFQGKRASISTTYDIGNDFYQAILDPEMIYSCGYAISASDDLATLQQTKLDRICKKLRLTSGEHILDVGCGWGGLLMHAAKHYGATGVGVTLSQRQHELATERVKNAGLSDKVKIQLKDFADVDGQFDRFVSVGMFEHVMRRDYPKYFDMIKRSLKPKGIGLLHAIGCGLEKNKHDPFIQKYIFPLSAQPKLSEVADHLEQRELAILDVENIIRHYQYTLAGWLANLRAKRQQLMSKSYNDSFIRMFEFYLCAGIAVSRGSHSAVYQTLFHHGFQGEFPLSRV
jgi:cyclopropane-fatty-acyl-phospholipid synthase